MFRSDFPILETLVNKKPLVYLDNGATTQKPLAVVEAIEEIYRHKNANIHRGVLHLSNVCSELYEQARKTVSAHFGATQTCEVVFTRNTTEALNLVAYGLGDIIVGSGDEVIVSEMEHHSNIVPWQLLCERRGAKLRVVPVTDKGELDLEAYGSLLGSRTKIVSIAHVSNVMGTVNDIRRIADMAHAVGAVMVVDGAQSAPHSAIDVDSLGADLFAFSGHKMYAPLGSGGLIGKREVLEQMQPWMGGGEMIDRVSFSGTTFLAPPLRFEAGTPDYVAQIGLAAAVRYLDNIGMETIEKHERELVRHLLDGLRTIEGVRLIGDADNHAGAVSFLIGNIHPYDAGMILDKMGIAVRTGHHCAQPLMERMGISGTVRASFGLYNTHEEVDFLLEAIERVKKMFS